MTRIGKSGVCADPTGWNGNRSVLLRKVKLDAMRYDSFIRCWEIKMKNQCDRNEVYSCTISECQMLTLGVSFPLARHYLFIKPNDSLCLLNMGWTRGFSE